MISFFSTDKTLGNDCDVHLLCAMIADHATLLAIFFFQFLGGRMLLRRWQFCKKIAFFFNFWQLVVPKLVIKGRESLVFANFEELFIGTVKMT